MRDLAVNTHGMHEEDLMFDPLVLPISTGMDKDRRSGLETIAATMNQDAGTLEDVVEPYLLQIAFLARTRRGRMLTERAATHLGVEPPTGSPDLFS